LNTVGSRGRGPREYVSLHNIYPEDDVVWLIDDSGKKALKYTASGRFLEGFDFEKLRFTEYHHSGNGSFMGFVPDLGHSTNVMLAFFEAAGMIDSILYRNPIPKNSTRVMFYHAEVSFINYGDRIKFKHLFNDTIYHISNNKLLPDMVLNLGARKANENARNEAARQNPNDFIDLFKGMDRALLYGESEHFVYLIVESVPIFYDKKERKTHKWKFILPEDERLDPEQSKEFVPLYVDKNGNLIGETASANLEDNPVIIIAKLK